MPMNIVEREPLEELIPLCLKKEVGVTIMKPVATGLLLARLALKWLLNQPISTAVPGATTLEELEEDALVGHLKEPTLTPREQEQVDRWAGRLEHVRCRICRECEPCPVEIPIGTTLGTDVMYDHYRTMSAEAFRRFPWSQEAVRNDVERRTKVVAAIEACTECGECEARCPYSLPIIQMLKDVVAPMKEMLAIWQEVAVGGT